MPRGKLLGAVDDILTDLEGFADDDADERDVEPQDEPDTPEPPAQKPQADPYEARFAEIQSRLENDRRANEDRWSQWQRQNQPPPQGKQEPEQPQFQRSRYVYDDEFYGLIHHLNVKQSELDKEIAETRRERADRYRRDVDAEQRAFMQAEKRYKDEYGDLFDKYCPESVRRKALQNQIDSRTFGWDWERDLKRFMFAEGGDELIEELLTRKAQKKQGDEVGAKRQNKETSKEKMAQVPPFGASNRRQVEAAPPAQGRQRDKFLRNAAKSMVEDMDRLMRG